MPRRMLFAGFVAALIAAFAVPAAAAWLFGSAGTAYGRSRSMPPGNQPSVSTTGRNVTVTWTKNVLPDGTDVQDYRVRRYNPAGILQTIPSGCDGFVAGLSCTEANIPAGTWTYTVSPRHANWIGPESAMSGPVDVAAPKLAFSSSTNITALPSVLNGDVTGFRAHRTLTFRLDNADTGTVLASSPTPSPIPQSGAATFNVTIPAGTPSGAHTVYAIDDQGEHAGAPIKVDIPPPTPTSLVTTNAGDALGLGRIEQGDSFSVVYSQQLDVASMCSTWLGNTSNQVANAGNEVIVRVKDNASLLGNDVMTVEVAPGTCGGTFNFGSIDLGGPAFVLGDAAFSGTGARRSSIRWTAASRTLAVTIGRLSSGDAPAKLATSFAALYTPHPGIRSSTSVPITGTSSLTGILF